jgi:hypothetical protein
MPLWTRRDTQAQRAIWAEYLGAWQCQVGAEFVISRPYRRASTAGSSVCMGQWLKAFQRPSPTRETRANRIKVAREGRVAAALPAKEELTEVEKEAL